MIVMHPCTLHPEPWTTTRYNYEEGCTLQDARCFPSWTSGFNFSMHPGDLVTF